MKTNKMMRVASVLLVAVLLTTCAISGTFAKYTTTYNSTDSARVAKWGFNSATIDFENLFAESYDDVKAGTTDMAIIAPGTEGSVAFKFENAGADATAAPEVGYTFTVDTEGSACNEWIKANTNITWALVKTSELTEGVADGTEYSTWDALIEEIEALAGDASGEKYYAPNSLPEMIDVEYTILWKWTFENTNDGNENVPDETTAPNDSYLGNAAIDEDLVVTLKVTITAEQVDAAPVAP